MSAISLSVNLHPPCTVFDFDKHDFNFSPNNFKLISYKNQFMDDISLKFQLDMFIICQVTAFSKGVPNIRHFVEGKLAPALQSFQKLETF